MEELERIEGNYYKMDLFVSFSLILFTIWVVIAKESIGWAIFLGVLAVLFINRGIFKMNKHRQQLKNPPPTKINQ